MGMSTHIQGFKAPDEKWLKMKAVWDVCKASGIEPPQEVYDYFEGQEPDEAGVVVELNEKEFKWSDDYCSGFSVEIAKLPKDLTHIRFYNSW